MHVHPCRHLTPAAPRFVSLAARGVCRQQSQGMLPPGVAFDLFRGQAAGQRDEVEAFPQVLEHEIK